MSLKVTDGTSLFLPSTMPASNQPVETSTTCERLGEIDRRAPQPASTVQTPASSEQHVGTRSRACAYSRTLAPRSASGPPRAEICPARKAARSAPRTLDHRRSGRRCRPARGAADRRCRARAMVSHSVGREAEAAAVVEHRIHQRIAHLGRDRPRPDRSRIGSGAGPAAAATGPRHRSGGRPTAWRRRRRRAPARRRRRGATCSSMRLSACCEVGVAGAARCAREACCSALSSPRSFWSSVLEAPEQRRLRATGTATSKNTP